jgi:hypothetical protein
MLDIQTPAQKIIDETRTGSFFLELEKLLEKHGLDASLAYCATKGSIGTLYIFTDSKDCIAILDTHKYKGFIIEERKLANGDIVFQRLSRNNSVIEAFKCSGLVSESLEEEKQKIDMLLSHEKPIKKYTTKATAEGFKIVFDIDGNNCGLLREGAGFIAADGHYFTGDINEIINRG